MGIRNPAHRVYCAPHVEFNGNGFLYKIPLRIWTKLVIIMCLFPDPADPDLLNPKCESQWLSFWCTAGDQRPNGALAPRATSTGGTMSRTDELNNTLRELQASTGDVEACAVVSEDGLIIASSLPQGVEEAQVAAMSAAMLSMALRTAAELRRGSLEQIFVKGDRGLLLILQAGANAVLLALARKEAKLGLIFYDAQRAADRIRGILG